MAELRAAFGRVRGRRSGRRRRGSLSPEGSSELVGFDPGSGPASCASRSPAATTCSTPAPRSPPPSSPASTSRRSPARSAGFPGVHRRLELKGERDGAAHLRRLRPPPDRGAGGALGAARAGARAADRRLPAPPLLADQGASPSSSAPRWRSPTKSSCSTSTRPARSRSASWPASAASTSPAPPPTGWAAGASSGRRPWSRRARRSSRASSPGAVLVTIGAGDVFTLGEALVGDGAARMSARPPGVERDFPAGAADHGPHRRRRRLVRAAARRGAAGRAAGLGRRRRACRSA